MKFNKLFGPLIPTFLITVFLLTFLGSCKDDDPEPGSPPSTGKVEGFVTDRSSGANLVDVRIILFDADNNEATGDVELTDADGYYSFVAPGGNYYVKVTTQGYQDIPVRGISPIPFTITNGGTTSNDIQMDAVQGNTGWISGTLTSSDAQVYGCLVVAVINDEGYSTISDSGGYYVIYNVPAGTYEVQAWRIESNSTTANATVSSGAEVTNVDLQLTKTSGSSVSGSITFLATGNKDVDVALTHVKTEESIPGMTTETSGGIYSMSGIPDGDYLARATYRNDGLVVDPDWIVKNGEPFVTVSGGNAQRDFSVTGSVELVSPTNDANSTQPVPTSSSPTFEWDSYSSTSDYVIEVTDANGNLIWGGFNSDWTVKNIVIPSSQTSIAFNSDGNATGPLMPGQIYRWKIYASKNSSQSPTGWELISVSEDQRGLIIIQ